MNYYISRAGRQYGPYTLDDLQRYLAEGSVIAGDFARGDAMPNWLTVGQVLAPPAPAVPAPPAAWPPACRPGYAPLSYAAPAYPVPLPPSVHWFLVFFLSFLTGGIFGLIWAFIQASWAGKLRPGNNAMLMYILSLCIPLGSLILFPLLPLGLIAGWIFWIIGAFSIRSSMEEYYNMVEPIQLRLSGPMTFFFSTLYFQYHMSRIHDWKVTGYLRP